MLRIRRIHVKPKRNVKGVLIRTDNNVCCFRHAIELAFKGEEIEEEIDEFGGYADMRSESCFYCKK